MNIKIKKINSGRLPEYKTLGSVGADCFARLLDKENPLRILPNMKVIIPLGFSVEIPEGYEMQIRPRSGLAAKNGITILNSPGTIDSDYRGEVGAIVINHSEEVFSVNHGDRIAQCVICPIIQANWIEVEELSETERGDGGYGSTGISDKKQFPKFYEPFTKIEEVEKFLNKSVFIDGKEEGMITAVKVDDLYGKKVLCVEVSSKVDYSKKMFDAVSAFTILTLEDGRRFGKEIR